MGRRGFPCSIGCLVACLPPRRLTPCGRVSVSLVFLGFLLQFLYFFLCLYPCVACAGYSVHGCFPTNEILKYVRCAFAKKDS
jgi:hypothetical protein